MTVEQYRKELKPARSKYGAIRTRGYASKAEARRADELKLMQKGGLIHNLSEHPRYVIIEKSEHGKAIHFTADFEYVDSKSGQTIVEDVKGSAKVVSRDWPLRARLFRERYVDLELRVIEQPSKNWKIGYWKSNLRIHAKPLGHSR